MREEVAHGDARAGGAPGLPHLQQPAARDGQLGARLLVGRPGGEGEAGYGGDGRQRLPPEAEGVDVLDVVHIPDLAGGVPLDAEQGVVARHAAAVVGHDHRLAPARHHLDVDLRGAGIQGVFDQLLQHRGGPLHHLAGGDLVDDLLGQELDGGALGHDRTIPGRCALSRAKPGRGTMPAGSIR